MLANNRYKTYKNTFKTSKTNLKIMFLATDLQMSSAY